MKENTEANEDFVMKGQEALARPLFVLDEPRPANVAVVFGHCDSALSSRRVRRAASLYHQGLVPRLLLSGGGESTADGMPEAEIMAGMAVALGVPEHALLLEKKARSTFENVKHSLELLHGTGLMPEIGTVLLVSCPWHMGRVYLMARQVFPSHVNLFCCPHDESCGADNWMQSPECCRFIEMELTLLARVTGAMPDVQRVAGPVRDGENDRPVP